MYKVEVHLKSGEPILLTTSDFEAIAKSLTGSQVIWLDNNNLGIWINPTEIVKILLQRLPGAKTPTLPTIPPSTIDDRLEEGFDITSYSDCDNPRCCMDQAMKDALIHQQHHIEG